MERIEQVVSKFSDIQDSMCSILEEADGKARFSEDAWEKDVGYGMTRVIQGGNVIEKGAVNFSKVEGEFTPHMAAILGESGKHYAAAGLSSILHSHNPFIPTIHMNVRYFNIDNQVEWFGGGIDLTPIYIDLEEAKTFHQQLKKVCDTYSPRFYNEYKVWADDYFFLPHRDETRGVGGIFFDRLKPTVEMPFNDLFQFTIDLASKYPNIYADIMHKKSVIGYNHQQKEWQKIRRGRYVEFNLLYDRGTKFGIETNGNAESILVSLPKEVTWGYKDQPEEGSAEAKTLRYLKKGVNWLQVNQTALSIS